MKTISEQIMKRVKRVHLIKYVILPHAFFTSLVIVGFYAALSLVEVKSVLANIALQIGLFNGMRYLATSFVQTDVLTQMSLVAAMFFPLLYVVYVYSDIKRSAGGFTTAM